MNWLDILIIIIVVLFTIRGYREGLVKQLINLFGFIISLFVAYYYYDKLAPYLVELIPAPNFDSSSFYFITQNFDLEAMYYNAIAFIIVFIIAKILLSILLVIIDQIAKLPGLAAVNRLAGAIIGFIQSAIILAIIVYFASIMPWEQVQSAINESSIASNFISMTPAIKANLYDLWNTTIQNL